MKNNKIKLFLCLILSAVMLLSVACVTAVASEVPDEEIDPPENPEVPGDHTHSFTVWQPIPGSLNKHVRHCECGKVEHGDCSFDDGIVTTNPTHESEGVMTYTCQICGGTKTEKIDKLDPGEPNPYEEEEPYVWVIPVVVACVAASGTALCGVFVYRKNAEKKKLDGEEAPTEDKKEKTKEKE